MPVRLMKEGDFPAVLVMMRTLWPTDVLPNLAEERTVFVWEREDGGLGGFAWMAFRPWAEGCQSSPVPYIEGWWVEEGLRRTGVGRALIQAVEQWCRDHGYQELGSDVELDNDVSLRAHAALGFEPTVQLQYFRKRL